MSKQEKNLEDVPFDETGQADKSKVPTASSNSPEIMSPADERDRIYKEILDDYKTQTSERKKQIKNFRNIMCLLV